MNHAKTMNIPESIDEIEVGNLEEQYNLKGFCDTGDRISPVYSHNTGYKPTVGR